MHRSPKVSPMQLTARSSLTRVAMSAGRRNLVSTTPSQPGGKGRLAQVIATRGGKAPAEAPFVIEHREALIYMLYEAAELEHGIMCQYLFAAFSLKKSMDEGLSEGELAAVTRWRKLVSHVATEEMLHFALVNNLLSAIGGAPHFARPNLPAPAHHYPAWRASRSGAFRRGGASALHFSRAPRGDGPEGRCRTRCRARPSGAANGRGRDRSSPAGLRDRRTPVPIDRAGHRPPSGEIW